MRALLPELNLERPLRETAHSGGAFVHHALTEPFREVLARELGDAAFEAMPDRVGPYEVRQHGAQFFLHGDDVANWPAIDKVRSELARLVHRHGHQVRGVAGWEPNEVAVQRYPAGSGGIGVHRDGKRYRLLVAIVTVEGTGTLSLCTDRQGTVERQWSTAPGSLTLLRGPELNGAGDGRPLHRLQTTGEVTRTSLTFRMNDHPPR
ncbi:hypothetical protein [Haloechinothrix sp. LS1_15]|uniref:hypothetical protein n=1 Tax=Haloechinothrix sp. LS1_15 TaxID=2652248 RepID=UPI0029441691|nr:hypothetical protein [Haloechinothrix sp. LS1_15]MDV6014642.1 hypothetical protein [Haloechinothrix sp. LS1_15]